MPITASAFGKDFFWGVSTSAYQAEGAHLKHGKGLSIWDEFTQKKGKIFLDQHANVSCDFYHHYHQDIALMAALNIPNFRFSLSWSRIFPDGDGQPNRQGVDFYKRIIDFCFELNITPWITLYHWDLPVQLERKGGWTNRDVINWFTDYAVFCVEQFGDSVKNWMILNEPMAFTGAGYFLGVHAPGRKGLTGFLAAMHHAALCQAEGARCIRALRNDLNVGSTFSFTDVQAFSSAPEDMQAASRADALLNRVFVEPLLGLGYPVADLKILQRAEQFIRDGDEQRLHCELDFIGVQCYTRELIKHTFFTPFIQSRVVKATDRNVSVTSMDWEIFPESIYNVLAKLHRYEGIPTMIVTENGAAFPDVVINDQVDDQQRVQFLEQHLEQVLRAKKDGIDVRGYFVWSLTDNFEWAEGYRVRFGLVYVDFETQKRIIKSSAIWYRKFLSEVTCGNFDTKSASLVQKW